MFVLLTITTLLFPPLTFLSSIILCWKYPQSWKKWIVFIAISVACFAYSYVTRTESDIVRYFAMLDACKGRTLAETFLFFDDGLYVKNTLFWIISRTDTYGLLPGITVGTIYYIAMYITGKTAEDADRCELILPIIMLQFMVLPFVSLVNNIRNVFSFSLAALAAFRDLYQKKRNILTLSLYIAPCFIHQAAYTLLAARLLLPLVKKQDWLFYVFPAFSTIAINIAHNYFLGSGVIAQFVAKAYGYLSDGESEYGKAVLASTRQQVTREVFFMMAIFLCLLLIYMRRPKRRVYVERKIHIHTSMGRLPGMEIKENQTLFEVKNKSFLVLLIATLSFALASFINFTTPAYWRFMAGANVMVGFLLITVFVQKGSRQGKLSLQTFFCFGCACTALEVYWIFRGAANVPLWIQGMMSNNGAAIILKVIEGAF